MNQALFYPSIDITAQSWLQTSMLYWERVRTIVPEPIAEPYSTPGARDLEAAGLLVPLRVGPGMQEIEELIDHAYTWDQEHTCARTERTRDRQTRQWAMCCTRRIDRVTSRSAWSQPMGTVASSHQPIRR